MERRSNNGLNNGKCSEHLYGNGNEQWLYDHGTIYGDDNDHDGFDQRSHDDVRWWQHDIDGLRRWHIRLERRSNNCLNNGKCSEHLYGNGNEQWLYEHGTIHGDDNNDDGFDQWSHDDVFRWQHDINGIRRWHVRVERRSNNGLNNGKCSEHLYGNSNK